ncbi:NAD(+)/NADH kinase [Amnibacterium kyonggiense]|uniref:ATP-NAD kinase n=1 Tax=Amnibacterium kyonggiense TaxID=595671 RepID=A0A4R7FLF4_9MICO|nr:NAD(+)/NADH kinase [Amnibacterium kyonggiense]TDS77241.1 ATP-NAD kinase [Amnibacterium kyonggiense]
MALAPRIVVVHRRSELDELIDRHATYGQAEFFLRSRGRSIAELQSRHDAVEAARTAVEDAVPDGFRRATVERSELDRYLFAPEDVIVAVGQDGLVANAAKYLHGQPVLGIDPEPGINAGVLVPFSPAEAHAQMLAIARGRAAVSERTMVEARLDDGQSLVALNDVYIGSPGHQSARWTLSDPGRGDERQSCSGLIAGTGTGSTGWISSIASDRRLADRLPAPESHDIAWFVREAWPSRSTGTALSWGVVTGERPLTITAQSDLLVAFGDGIERDRLSIGFGQRLTVAPASARLRLVVRSR